MSLASLSNKTATITRTPKTAGAIGGHIDGSPTTLYAALPVSLQPAKGETIEEFGKRDMQISHVAFSSTAVDLKAGDVFADDATGTKYLVIAFGDMAGRGRAYAIYLLEKGA